MAEMMNVSEAEYRMLKQEAETYHTQGFQARKKGSYQEAIDLYTKAL
jgi:hypothetical protein